MNKTPHKKRKFFLISLAILLSLALAATIFLPYLVDINNYKGFIETKAEELLNRRVSIEQIQLHLINGIGIRCVGVRIGDASEEGDFISAKDMLLKFKPLPLLKKEVAIRKIILEYPQINLERDSKGKFNFPTLIVAPPTEAEKVEEKWKLSRLSIDKILIRKGSGRLLDKTVNDRGLPTNIKELNLSINNFELGQPFELTLDAELKRKKNKTSHIELSARVIGLDKNMLDLSHIKLTAQAKIKNWDVTALNAYYKKYLPWDYLAGLANMELDYRGNLSNDFTLDAKVALRAARLTYNYLYAKPVPVRAGKCKIKLTLKNNRLDLLINSIDLDCGQFNITGELLLANLLSPKRSIKLQTAFSPFSFEYGKRYITYEVIPDKAADFIKNSVHHGTIENLSVGLDGEIRRLKEIKKPENYGLLSASANFNGLSLVLGNQGYSFRDVTGSVDLRDGILSFDTLNANLGAKHIKIYDSQISNLYSAPQFEIHSTSTLAWNDSLIKENLPAKITEKINIPEPIILQLQANGNSQKLTLKGKLDLTRNSYTYGSWLKKETELQNSLDFDAQLHNWKNFDLQRITYHLNESQLLVNLEKIKPLKLDIQTRQFDIQDLRQIIPDLFTPQSSGLINADIRISPAAASPEEININGKTSIQQGWLQLEKYPIKLEGESPLHFDISSTPGGLKINAETELTQTAYSYKDWLHKPRGLKNVVTFQGTLEDTGSLQIEKLLIALDSSLAKLSGRIKDFESLDSKLKITGEQMNFDHIIPLYANLLPGKIKDARGYLNLDLELDGPLKDSSQLKLQGEAQVYDALITGEDPAYQLSNLNLKLTDFKDSALGLSIQAGQGFYKKLKFSNVTGQAGIRSSQLLIDSLSLNIYQGNLLLKGKLALALVLPPAPPRYDLSFTAEGLDVSQLAKELQPEKGVISGKVRAIGQLSNTGEAENNFAGMNGIVKLRLTDGVIKRYGVLAKIFSMISPRLLLSGKTPDFETEGFPYQSIEGKFIIINGVATTEDLILSSDAWKIVTLGQIDMGKKQLELKVYVQPLQALDDFVSRIPLVGKILKGEKRGVLDTYFTVTGNMDAPVITAKPISSLGETIFGIIKRTLSLPFTIFSDQGGA